MKIVLIVTGALVLLGCVIYLWGKSMPREHAASVSTTIATSPEALMATISAFEDLPKWRKSTTAVQVRNGVITETTGFGPISYRVVERAPLRMVTEIIGDPSTADFGGTWTYELTPEGTSTRIHITENGFVNPSWMRVMSKYVFGHERTLRQYVEDLRRKFA